MGIKKHAYFGTFVHKKEVVRSLLLLFVFYGKSYV